MKFDKFKGISEEREIEKREKSSLEHLIDTGRCLMQEYALQAERIDQNPGGDDAFYAFLNGFYNSTEKALENVFFTEHDLRSYILAKADKEETNADCGGVSVALHGLYTSALLELLTARNKARGERTRFYINGQGGRFDSLFGFCRNLDCLYVDNFISHCIGVGGSANIIIAKNIRGEGVLAELGEYGSVGLAIVKNCEGDFMLDHSDPVNSMLGLVIAENIKGENCLESFGSQSKVGMIVGKNISGKKVMNYLGTGKGYIGVVAGININAEQALADLGSNYYGPDGSLPTGIVRTLLYENVKAKKIAETSQILNKFCKEQQPEEYAKQMQEYRINEILELVDSMEGKTPEEVFDIADKIQAVYGSIKEKVEK